MVNRIPNGSLLTNKLGLLNSLQEYAKVCGSLQCIASILHIFCTAKVTFITIHIKLCYSYHN